MGKAKKVESNNKFGRVENESEGLGTLCQHEMDMKFITCQFQSVYK